MSTRRVSIAVLVLGLSAAAPSPAFALANRVFASQRSGNDANSCDNISTPCRTLAGAVAQLNPGGEAIVLDSGGYGPVVITKSVTIEAAAGVTAFIHPPAGDAIEVAAGSTDVVTLRGLTLSGGTSDGITVGSVGALFVENCSISGFLYGIYWSSPGRLVLTDSVLKNNSNNGIQFYPTSGTVKVLIARSRVDNNGWGIGVSNASGGSVFATLRDSVIANNPNIGLEVDDGAEANVENCTVVNNGTGIAVGIGAAVIRVSNSIITDNSNFGLSNSTGTLLSRGNNTIEGNGTNTSGVTFYGGK